MTLVCRTRYVLSHDNTAKTADWVLERLRKRELTNRFNRPQQSFLQDARVPPRGRAKNGDYTNTRSKFARGHMAPSEDFNSKKKWMIESFVYSNAVPQVGDKFNGAIWGQFEKEVRNAAQSRGEIYVITGPVRRAGGSRTRTVTTADNDCGREIMLQGPEEAVVCDANNKDASQICDGGVSVPIALYKIIYDPQQRRAYAFILPNRDHPSQIGDAVRPYIEQFRTTVAVVQRETGLSFFGDFPDERRNLLVQKCGTDTLWAPR